MPDKSPATKKGGVLGKMNLSFVRQIGVYANYWSPEISGDWREDTSRGKQYADETIACIRSHNNPTALAHVIKSMVGAGNWTGVEVGFFHRISEYLIASDRAALYRPVGQDHNETE